MRSFFRYLILLSALVTISWAAIPGWFNIRFPRQAGPHFNREVRRKYITTLNKEQPDIVLLGDSTMMEGVDPELLSELTGRQVSSFHSLGSASAFWYLILKNNIVIADHHPQTVIIVFRDTMLTAPGFRVYGGFLDNLDEFATDHETVLLEKAYLNHMNWAEIQAEEHIPLYSARENLREKVDTWIRYLVPAWLGCDRQCTDDAMFNVFTSAELEPGQLQSRITTVEEYLYTPSQLDFHQNVDQSFLPEIIQLTRENNIQLIVVRLKPNTIRTIRLDAPAVGQYITDLSSYLAENGVVFLDYGRDPRLRSDYFRDSLHLKPEGKTLFTQILAEGLNGVLKKD
ncbi:MAG: hypothetical protein HXY35_07825 [Chloroflexi bacterium]|nr:hypothetical protein [Chloroflexota bacterium]